MMPLVGEFPRGSPVSPVLASRCLLHSHLISLSSALKTLLRAAQISSLTHSPARCLMRELGSATGGFANPGQRRPVVFLLRTKETRRRADRPSASPFKRGAAVAERLACSPSSEAKRVPSPAGSIPDFRMRESCRTMSLVGGAAPYSSRFTLIGSEDDDSKSRPKLFILSLAHFQKRGHVPTPLTGKFITCQGKPPGNPAREILLVSAVRRWGLIHLKSLPNSGLSFPPFHLLGFDDLRFPSAKSCVNFRVEFALSYATRDSMRMSRSPLALRRVKASDVQNSFSQAATLTDLVDPCGLQRKSLCVFFGQKRTNSYLNNYRGSADQVGPAICEKHLALPHSSSLSPKNRKEGRRVVRGDCVASVYEWAGKFKEGRTSVCHEKEAGRPSTSTTDCNTERPREIILLDTPVTALVSACEIVHGERPRIQKVCSSYAPENIMEE
ncbi:hypothetical protein PR048_007692 [Dryococelus australis]|uniref:Uncharacterized protein n=1 Tax=Dryococelus australis TaxID=614101 RepID=A0ABQ9HVW3_9NEOP|nr:hypothetical protein PR048_007692 [Dryococelus australis]